MPPPFFNWKSMSEGLILQCKTSDDKKLDTLIGHYPVKILIGKDAYMKVGKFSLGITRQIRILSNTSVLSGELLTCGNFCEFSNCDILIGGDHQNEKPINVTISRAPAIRALIKQNNALALEALHKKKTIIGHNVVIGSKSVVLSGAQIGTGSIIGATSLVSGRVDEFTISAGVPCRSIKNRFDQQEITRLKIMRWWDLTTASFVKNIENINRFELANPEYDQVKSARIVLEAKIKPGMIDGLRIVGIENSKDEFIELNKLDIRVQKYFEQIHKVGGDITFVENILTNYE